MPDLPQRKVGIVACSGEELAEGTVARLAALKVLHELRPGKTVTICLPLFLAGGEGDRAFARFHPTITVDGCELRCAARGTEKYSGKPVASIVVAEIAAAQGIAAIEGRRSLNEAGKQAEDATAQRLAELVDTFAAKGDARDALVQLAVPQPSEGRAIGCSCRSGVPAGAVWIGGKPVALLALSLIFQTFQKKRRSPEDIGDELLQVVKIYNDIPPGEEARYRDALVREYAAFCAGKE